MKTKDIHLVLTEKELNSVEALAALTGSDISKTIRACIRQSAGAVQRAHIKKFVKKALAMPGPLEGCGVFEPPPATVEEFEDRVLKKQLAWKKEAEGKGAKERRDAGERFRNGYSQSEFYAAVSEDDRVLAEKTLSVKKETSEDLAEYKRWWNESEPKRENAHEDGKID